MPKIFKIDLKFTLPGSGQRAREVVEMYLSSSMVGDINQLAWNLLDCSDDRMAQEFSNLVLQKSGVIRSRQGGFKVTALLTVSASNSAFLDRVFSEYMDAFEDYIRNTSREYFSRTGFNPDLTLATAEWDANISLHAS